MEDLQEYLAGEFKMLDRGFVATPNTREDLESFARANQGSMDILLMQMAMNFAEEESCIPLLAAGLQSPQVADTATGSAIMMQACTTLLDFMS